MRTFQKSSSVANSTAARMRALVLLLPLMSLVGCGSGEQPAADSGVSQEEQLKQEAARIQAEEQSMMGGSDSKP